MPFELQVIHVEYEHEATILRGYITAGALDEPEVVTVPTLSGHFSGEMTGLHVYGGNVRPLTPDPTLLIEITISGHPAAHDVAVPVIATSVARKAWWRFW